MSSSMPDRRRVSLAPVNTLTPSGIRSLIRARAAALFSGRLIHQKSFSVAGDGVIEYDVRSQLAVYAGHFGLEQRARSAALKVRSSGDYGRRHHFSIGAEIKNLFSVTPPTRWCTSVVRDPRFAPGGGETLHVDLRPAGLIGRVRNPLPIG